MNNGYSVHSAYILNSNYSKLDVILMYYAIQYSEN